MRFNRSPFTHWSLLYIFFFLRILILGHSINDFQFCTYVGIHLLKAAIKWHCLVTRFLNDLACMQHSPPSVSTYKRNASIFDLLFIIMIYITNTPDNFYLNAWLLWIYMYFLRGQNFFLTELFLCHFFPLHNSERLKFPVLS